ncbi:PAN domain-containing protein [Mesorhizobium sp.]|uniref:PAN domain-containing protein n=1 Tax=Mesorhizobium sp. TaxID=1871066 RepID=UPI0025B9C876|nr:PAN domain-containing protein [Mesorhizobium sp.]
MLTSLSYCVNRLLPVVWLLLAVQSCSAHAAVQSFGPFTVDDAHSDVISLNGEIDAGAALNFRRAAEAAPNAKLVVLNSSGGVVQIALLIADDVHERKLATFIPKKAGCYSACAYVFLAGVERQVEGELGVHQISSDSADLVSAQLSISDIIDLLNRFDTPIEVLTVMFKTPPNDMHVFTPDEVARYGIDRRQGSQTNTASNEASPPSRSAEPPSATTIQSAAPMPKQTDAADSPSLSKLSSIEEYTRRPTRMAVFAGLDLYGDDISSRRTDDAANCARACLSMGGECKAFTFNVDPHVARGPNCFLKASQGKADGNSAAISGKFLSSADPDPNTFSMGVIDPKTALFENVDLPGGDLSRRPFGRNVTAQQCRLACVANKRCIGFTYMKRKSECWLKGTVGTPRFVEGMISGLKKMTTFAPASIITLE